MSKTDKPIRYNIKQVRTVENYFNPRDRECFGNLSASAIKAGYSKSYANSIVRDTPWINELKQQLQRYGPDHIYQGFQDVAQNADRDVDKLRALELMGKSQGMFIDRVQQDVHVTFENSVPRPKSEIIDGERVDGKDS